MPIRKMTGMLLALALPFLTTAFAAENVPQMKNPSVFAPSARYTFKSVLEGVEVSHEFKILNKGSAELKIFNVRTD